MLSEAVGDQAEVTLIDKTDAFVFGFAKFDVMFGRATPDEVRLPYRDVAKPGVRLLKETVTAIDPDARRVTTDAGVHEADVLVVALGADYDMDATPGLAEGGNEFYSEAGAERLARLIPDFSEGHAVVGVCGAPFKCPPAPSECALLLDDELNAARRAGPLPDLVRDSAPHACAPLARDVGGADVRVRRARHHPDPRAPHRLARPGAQRHGARRRHRAGVRPLPRRAQAPRSGRGDRQRHDRGRLRARGLGHAADAPPRRLRGRGRGHRRGAEGGRVRRGRRTRGGSAADRRHPGRRGTGPLRRKRVLLHRVRAGTRRESGHRLPVRPHKTGIFNPPSAALVAEKQHFGSSRRERWFGS